MPTDYTYTGQREVTEIELKYYIARWYDSEIGHFLQADTIIPDFNLPLAFNRYAYVTYNPLKYTDPSGHDGGDEEKNKTKKEQIDEWLTNPCTRDFHFCALNSGGLIDNSHYNSTEAHNLLEWLLTQYENGVANARYIFSQAGFHISFEMEFEVDFSKIDSYEMLYQVGAGIWLAAQRGFEYAQLQAYPLIGGVTSFSLPDLSSTFLAYVAEVRGYGYDEVVDILGGGFGFDGEMLFFKTIFGPKNASYQMMNIVDNYPIPYPAELNITPLFDDQIWWKTNKKDKNWHYTGF